MRALYRLAMSSIAGVAIGVVLGSLYWGVAIYSDGHSIWQALAGHVEDGIGLLQGLIALGGLVGLAVGIVVWSVPTTDAKSTQS